MTAKESVTAEARFGATDRDATTQRRRHVVAVGSVGMFFALKVLVGMALVIQSARSLSIADFGTFSQLFLFLALLSTVSAGGVQNGLIRQIAAANHDVARERHSTAAAFVIWAAFCGLLSAIALTCAKPLSELLVGNARARTAVPLIAVAALGAGAGQLLCAVLTGKGRAAASLSLQAAGLVIGGAGCWLRLAAGDAQGAVIAYSAGPVATMVLALPWTWKWMPIQRRAFANLASELRLLIGFSGAFLATATIMPATLFALRYAYRLEFGGEALGYWLAANRVSDVTSQLLGLFMGQLYLPQVTRARSDNEVRRVAVRALAAGWAVMGGGLIVFAVLAPLLVRTFLSAAYIPAIPFISGYLVGDTLRVATSLSLHTALARGRLRLYVSVEAMTAALIAAAMLPLIALGRSESAYWGYAIAHGAMAVLAGLGWRARLWTGEKLGQR